MIPEPLPEVSGAVEEVIERYLQNLEDGVIPPTPRIEHLSVEDQTEARDAFRVIDVLHLADVDGTRRTQIKLTEARSPSWEQDPIARHFGWVEGVPACEGSPCFEHGWPSGPS